MSDQATDDQKPKAPETADSGSNATCSKHLIVPTNSSAGIRVFVSRSQEWAANQRRMGHVCTAISAVQAGAAATCCYLIENGDLPPLARLCGTCGMYLGPAGVGLMNASASNLYATAREVEEWHRAREAESSGTATSGEGASAEDEQREEGDGTQEGSSEK